VVDPALVRSMTATAGLRNRIARAYAPVDVDRPWGERPDGIDALERFAEAVARFLGPAES
jgi:uncharacterized protein YutE (UPF0331/DUF86 family)